MKKGAPSFSYYELIDACGGNQCPICTAGQTAARRHLTALIYDGVNDVDLRAQIRDALGYCHEHAWQLPQAGESAPLGIAIVHRDVLNTVSRRLQGSAYSKGRGAELKERLADALGWRHAAPTPPVEDQYFPATAACPACVRRDETAQLALKALLQALDKGDERMVEAFRASAGLCLPHLRQCLAEAHSVQTFELLVAISQAHIATLIGHLDEFVRKSDYRFRDEASSAEERSSWRRALQMVSGPQAEL